MSAGQFTSSFYETDTGVVARIRIQPETAALVIAGSTNAPPAGPATATGSATVSRSRRSNGINARLVRFKFNAAYGEYDAGQVLTLPWLQSGVIETFQRGDAGTYDPDNTGTPAAVTYVGRTAENIN